MASPRVPRYVPPEMSYKEREGDVTEKLLSQQVQKPKTLNVPLKSYQEIQKQTAMNANTEAELNRMADKIYNKIENRLLAEKRRFGL